MKTIKITIVMFITTMMVTIFNAAIAMDIRTFGLEFQHNKQDEQKNTFWHNLAYECNSFKDWSEVQRKTEDFKKNNKNWLPNPLIENNNNNTARKEAKNIFKKSGNPVCGLLVIYFKQQEESYLNRMALEQNRKDMVFAQHINHPNQ